MSLDDRVLALEHSVTWYKGAFWIASAVLGAVAVGAVTYARQSINAIQTAKDDALEEIEHRECKVTNTHWMYSFNFPARKNIPPFGDDPRPHMIDIPFTYLATTNDPSSFAGYYYFKQSEYLHDNERFWRYVPEGAGHVEAIETLSLDGKLSRRFLREPLPGFVFQTEILNPDQPLEEERNKLRMRLVAPEGCTKLVLGA